MEIAIDEYQEESDKLEDLGIPFNQIEETLSQFLGAKTGKRSLKFLKNTANKHQDFSKLVGYMVTLGENGELDKDLIRQFEDVYKNLLKSDLNTRDAKVVGSVFVAVAITFLYVLYLDPSYTATQRATAVMGIMSASLQGYRLIRNRRLPKRLERLEEEAIVMVNAFAKLNATSIEERENAMRALTGESLESLLSKVDSLTPDEVVHRLGNNLDLIHGEM